MTAIAIARILVALENVLRLAEDDLPVPAAKITQAAGRFLAELPEDDTAWVWPESNRKGEQIVYLERLLARALRGIGSELQEGKKDPIPQGGRWEGEGPPHGKMPGGLP